MQFAQVPVNSPCAESHLQPIQVATSAQKDRTRDEAQRKLEWACLFCVLFMFVEFLGGYLAGSLAIMSDAAHLLSDVLSFFLSLFALYLSKFPASKTMSHGYKRAEVLGALTSIVVIWMLTLGLVWAAIQRIIALVQAPDSTSVPPVNGKAMFIVACMGLVVNIALMKILGHGHSHGGHGHSHGGGGHGHSHGAVSKEASSHHGHSHSHHGHSHSHGQDHVDHDASNRHEHHEDKHHACSHSEHDHHVRSQGHDEPVSPIGIDDESRVSTATACTHDSDDLEEPEAEPSVHVDGDGECAAENLNVRAAYLHALGDFLQSLGVCVAGALIWYVAMHANIEGDAKRN
ncbi:hypothetical protein, variant [Aphanomyces invadans]|uniref:Cation efflux protein transmembrane domain-containing protein n=1 Tax=Aphanomyces invadans TaxID=157072 RepID=A0A024U5A4_9STRA|nr:hypothetical protein, variant [Aphanomyces invadans]ETW01390.1 hypothetical protein, variant [Aphanomyces invadans]|eukprot:XP_008870388.1 hypothetical protein, variant [Aphanomyces invadans]